MNRATRELFYKKMCQEGGDIPTKEENQLVDWFFEKLENLTREANRYFGEMDIMAMLIIQAKCFAKDKAPLNDEQIFGFLNECVNNYSPTLIDFKKDSEELENEV